MNELSELFKLVAEDKKKKKEEFDSVVGDLGLDSLFNEFATLKKKEKEKKVEEQKEQESIIGEITLDSVFEEVTNLKKETKKKKVQEQKTVQAFEKWLYSETTKEQEQIIEDVIEESLDEVLEVLEDHKEELEEPKEDLIEKSLGLLAEPSNTKVQQDPITPLNQKFATLDDLQKHYSTFLSRIQQQISTLGGGGETRLKYLDDVVGVATNSSAYHKGLLEWNSTTNTAKFEELGNILVNETLDTVTDRGNITNNAISVGFVTATGANISGNVTLGANSSNLIDVPGRISSNFYPSGDGVYNLGRAPQIGSGANRWKDANFLGKGTFDGGVDAHDLELGVGSANLIYSTSGNLELNSQSGTTNIDDILTISGNTGIGTVNPTQKLHVQGNVRITGGLYDSNNNVGATGSILVSTGTGVSWTTPNLVFITGITSTYTATSVVDYIGVNATVPVTITLPSSAPTGKKITVKDEGNKIATYNITVQAGAGTSVENDSSVIMTINHQSFTYFYNGSNWFLI